MVSTTSSTRGQVDRLLARIRGMREGLMNLVVALTHDELHWIPDEGIPSVADHLGHLARCDGACRRHLATGVPPEAPARTPEPRRDLSRHLGDLARERARLEECLRDRTDACLDRADGSGASPREILEDLLIREAHHRALILSLLQLMDPERKLPHLFR